MRNSLKTVFFLSSFSPTLLALAAVRYFISGADLLFYQLISVFSLGLILFILIFNLVINKGEKINFKAKKVESTDYFLLVFLAAYTAPIIMRMVELNFKIISIILGLLMVTLWVMPYIPSHPLMYLLKYKFYKVESDNGVVYTLISKRNIRDPKTIKEVISISDSMLMEK
ncbi:hypothetical protein BBM13_11935 [Vibrio parahaemolyticus]|uniref:hypothetical protein n=1 Tax=Vibrio parahaemolyticus TaxID=670 RepID=UPI00084A8582|nr:hypothetical protein [Vibrio parahaemolyticus]EGQ8231941.1 hypothetical protein [Vibrio parahaemolyticus]ODX82653.1 hypothetical protein BBM12_01535 [Vibrio parahaemolyticus]ODX85358.1 hypothetical protein BBM93_12970 [Vibrio parahaemolyticus]ODX88687.1 hypothetical protein BBM13_11935 [Vibrio parahaemolyticus]ODX96012.1 hypothetical protein BBM95_21045 [Vibrio parahaemolyticus]